MVVRTRPTDLDSDGIYESSSTLASLKTMDSGKYTCTVTAMSSDTFVTASDPASDQLMISVGKSVLKVLCNAVVCFIIPSIECAFLR